MHRCLFLFIVTLCSYALHSQEPVAQKDSTLVENDTIQKIDYLKHFGNGYFPTKFLNIDLRYLLKFNQYEGLRTGLGGITNDAFSQKYRINSYVVYGFKDHRFKYKIGGGFRVNEATETWINLSYTDDLQETGSSNFLTDKRFFQFFEPRLLNIDLFHRHITKAVNIQHKISNHIIGETEFALSKINPTYNYIFSSDEGRFRGFDISTAKISLQWNPFSKFETLTDKAVETKDGYPKFTLQLTQSFKNIINSDFNFFKIDFRTRYKIKYNDAVFSEIVLSSGLAAGNTPITHLYHAYPNNIRKETVLQRFSVAGINSFETMYFNEFFSDRFATLQFKHFIKPFEISERFKPQMVLISRFAVGDMNNIERHENISFGTLEKGYSEAGFEINKLLFGFGLSFAYRYGSYHLPEFTDNIALKFTFNVSL